jgi:DNA-binding transcriptional regulator YhcF (GntR family)
VIIEVDPSAALPVYEQIRAQVVRMVLAGTLEPGTRIPTIRQLAGDLRLAKGTVAKAYALLESAEVIETRGHRGSFIVGPPTGVEAEAAGRELDDAATAFVVAARQLGFDLDTAAAALARCWNLRPDST